MMFFVAIVIFLITTTLQVFPVIEVKTQLTYYVLLLLITLVLHYLTRNSFNLGYFRYTNETKLQISMALKAFLIVFLTLQYSNTSFFFDYDVNQCHKDLNTRLNQALSPFGIISKEIPYEYTYSIFALIASIISFCVVRIHIKFAYFFYIVYSDEGTEEEGSYASKYNRVLRGMLLLSFLFPLIIVLVFINPLTKSLFVPNILTDSQFTIAKWLIVLVSCIARALTFRQELQN